VAFSAVSLDGVRFRGTRGRFFCLLRICAAQRGIGICSAGGTGIVAMLLSMAFDSSRIRLYAVYDYWHSGPNFFLMRCGILLVILFFVYAWCRWGFGQKGFSPLIQLGKTSLLVYWVHIEFVYGRFSILPKGQCSQLKATGGLILIFLAMLALSLLRTSWKKRAVSVSRRTLRQLLRQRNLDDHFAGFGKAQLVTGDFFDLVRVGLQFPHFLLKL